TLRFLSTAQAAEDLEALRRYLGADTMTIYGAADGSLLAQAYAAAHPAQVWRLILDAPLDPGVADLDRLAEAARASDQVLTATLAECATAAPCTRDVVGKDALAAFDGLMTSLVQEPKIVELTNGSGGTTTRTVGAADLALVAQTWLGTERDRMLLQRAIAAASQGRWWHLVRMLDLVRQGRLGPGAAPEQAGATEAARLAIACADADLGPGSDEDRASAWLAAARVTEATDTRLARMLAADLPCAFWPGRPAAGGAAEGDADGAGLVVEPAFPVLLLGATLDPSAPWANGERIASRAGADHVQTLVTAGGPHITYGRTRDCPDTAMTALLASGTEPEAAGTCTGAVADAYVPIAPATRDQVGGTKTALLGADREIVNLPDLAVWAGESPLRVGCPFGGTVAYAKGDGRTELNLDRCAFTKGVPVTGTGTLVGFAGALELTLDSGDPAAPVTYRRLPGENPTVTGVLKGLSR
ncbi:MAG: alpha/beta hydrolase, partial [Chloroflexota bacterium]